MTFLSLGSNEPTTFSATEKSAVNVRLQTLAMRFRFSAHHFGNGIKKFLCNNRFVLTLKNLSVIPHETSVNRIFEKFLIIRHRKLSTAFSLQSKCVKFVADFPQSEVPSCICLKCLFNQNRKLGMWHDTFSFLVHISNRRHLRPYSFLHFVSMSALNIFRQIIHIILGLRKSDREHEFALRCRIKPKSWKFHLHNYTSINEVDDFPPIYRVASKSIRMPRQNTRRFAFFHSLYHFIKHG